MPPGVRLRPSRFPIAALVALAGAFACSGIVTGPDAGPSTSPRRIAVTPPRFDLNVGDTARIAATLYDALGNPTTVEPGRRLAYASGDSAIARVDSAGLVLGVADGTTTVRASYGALGLTIPVTVTGRPRLVLVSGGAQTGEQGDTLAAPVVVRALNAAGQPVADTVVRFVVRTGGGLVTTADARTDAAGLATTRWVLGLALGEQRLVARQDGFDSVSVAATATAGTRPVRVALTTPRLVLDGPGDAVAFSAAAYNVADVALPGATITWTSANSTVATVSATGLVTAVGAGSSLITARSGAAADSVVVIVRALPRLLLGADASHAAGMQRASSVDLEAPAPASVSVTIRSLDAATVLVGPDDATVGGPSATVALAAGATGATYWMQAIEGTAGRTVSLVAEAPGYAPDTMVVTIGAPAFRAVQPGASTVPAVGGADPVLVVEVGAEGTGGFTPLPLRAGGVAPSFTVTTDAPTRARPQFFPSVAATGAAQGPADAVTFALAPRRSATLAADSAGELASLRVVRAGISGTATLTVQGPAGWGSSTPSATWQFTPAGVPRIVVVSGDGQQVPWGALAPDSLKVRVLDADGLPVEDALVTFTVSPGGGSVTPANEVTDADGYVATQWRLGSALGAHTVTVARNGYQSAVFTGTALAGTFVTRLRIVASRTTFTGAGDGTSFSALTYNVADSLITGRAVAWSSANTAVATVDAAGSVVAVAPGQALIRASYEDGRDSVLVTVLAPVGVRHWTGAVSSDWTVPANWLEGAVPTVADSVVIPATGVTALPVIPATTIRALVQRNAAPVAIEGDGGLRVADALVLRSDVLSATCSAVAGIRLIAPTSAGPHPLSGSTTCGITSQAGDRVLVDSLVLAGRSLDLSGTARLTLAGRTVRSAGEQLFVQGDARLEMLDPADRVYAGFANLTANGQGDMFAAGELHLASGLAVIAGSGAGFVAAGTHRIVLASAVAADTAHVLLAAGVRLRHLDVRMPTRVDGTALVDGDVTLAATGALVGIAAPTFGLPERLRVAGDFTAAAGATTTLRLVELGGALTAPSFAPDTAAFIGTGQRVPFDGTVSGLRNVRVSGTATARVLPLQRRFIDGDLVIDGDFGMAEAFNAAIGVNGSLRVTGSGILRLGGTWSSIRVEGNALFDGRAMTNELARGDLELRGDLVQRASTSPASLRAAPPFIVYFIGTGATDFATPDQSWLGNVEHWGNLTRTLRSDLTVQGIVRHDLNNLVVRSDVLGAGGVRRITAQGLDFGGSLTVRNVAYRIIDGAPISLSSGPVFSDFDPAAVQLEFIRSSGAAVFAAPTFTTVPTAGGRYLRVSDPDGAANGSFTLAVQGATPATHGGFAEAIAPATITDWPSGLPTVTFSLGGDARVGAGLMRELVGTLSEPAPSALSLVVRSFDAAGVRVSATGAEGGTTADTLVLAAGTESFSWWVHGLEGLDGAAVAVELAVNDVPVDTVTITVVAPRFRLSAVGPTTLPVAGGDVPWLQLEVGAPVVPGGPGFAFAAHPVRAGSPGVSFAVGSSAPSIARLLFRGTPNASAPDQGPADTVTFALNAGYAQTFLPAYLGPELPSLRLARTGLAGTAEIGVRAPAGWTDEATPIALTLTPLTPTRIEAVSGSGQSGRVGTAAAAPAVARVVDANGTPVAGVAVAIQYIYGGGLRDTRTDTTDVNGEVRYAFTFPLGVVDTRVEFAVAGLTGSPVVMPQFPVAGPADRLVVRFNTGSGIAGLPILPGFTVWATDANANIDLTFTGAITMTLTNGPPTALLGGTTTRAAVAGVAVFDDLTVDTPSSSWVLIASSAGLASGASAAFSISAPALQLTMPSGGLVGVNLTEALRVTLPFPAPAGGTVVTLTSTDPTRVAIVAPAARTVPAGSSSVDFEVAGVSPGVANVSADADGFATASLSVTVTNQILSLPTTQNVPLGQTTTIPIQLAVPAPAGGLAVALVSGDPSRVSVETPTVVVPAGATLASGTLRGVASGTATITATAAGWVSDATLATTTAQIDIVESSLSLNATFGTTMTVQLRSGGSALAAPAPGVTVALTSLDATCASVPASLTIPTGQTSATAPVAYGGSAPLSCSTRIRATGTALEPDSVGVTVLPAPGISAFGVTTGSGLQAATGASLNASNYGSTTVTITSSNPDLVRVAPNASTVGAASIAVPMTAPSTGVSYVVSAVEGATGSATLTFSAPGFTGTTTTVTVRGIGVDLLAVPTTTTSFSSNAAFQVRVGALNAAGTAIEAEHPVRAGGIPFTATITSSSAAIARLVTATDSGAVVTATIPVGATRTSGSGASSGGVELDPVGPGTATITATVDGAVATAGATATVTVSAPTISAAGGTLGAGLQFQTGGSLGASNYGLTTTVHVESSDPALFRIAPNASTVGSAAIDIPLLTPSTSFGYVVQAMEGVTGTGTITVSAPGFQTATATVTVRGLGVDLISVPTTTTTFSPNSAFQVRIGTLNAAGTAIESEHPIRVGGVPLVATVTNSTAAVAQIVTSAGAGQVRTVTIPVGSARSPSGAASGGVEFDPIGGGITSVTATVVGATSTANASVTVSVNAPTTLAGGVTLGQGLQAQSGGSLGASDYGAVTVRVESSDSTLFRLARAADSVGRGVLEFTVTAPTTSFGYVIQAMEGVTGSGTITLSAPGFVTSTATVTVRPLALDLISLPAGTTSLSPNSAFTARIGTANAAGTAIESEYPIRRGGTPITVTIVNSNATVAQLVTQSGAGQSATLTIPVGATRTPSALGAGGVEFDPLSSGTTTVSVTAPGVISGSGASAAVTVTAPSMTAGGVTIGAGLQAATGGSLGASNYGTTTVHIESSDPALVRIAPNAATIGTASVDVAMTAPATSFGYVIQAVEGVTGSATITVSAPGFTPATALVTVRALAIELVSLPSTTTALSPNTAFTARVGTLNAGGTAIESEYAIRTGGVPITVTFGNANAAVAQLVSTAGSGQSATATIPVGATRTPSSVASGGVEFDPIAAGTTIVTASAPGVASTTGASQAVVVSTPAISVPNWTIGAGTQVATGGSLGASAYGAVTVRVESIDPTRVVVAPNAATVGSTAIDVALTAPSTSIPFVIAALEGVTGTGRIVVSAPGFTPDTMVVTVRALGLEFLSLPSSAAAGSANRDFNVRVGTLNTLGTALESEFAIRTGGTPVVVTITSSNAAAAALATSGGTGASATVTIPVGATRSPNGIAAGGVALVPVAAGTATLGATSAQATSPPSATAVVTITP